MEPIEDPDKSISDGRRIDEEEKLLQANRALELEELEEREYQGTYRNEM